MFFLLRVLRYEILSSAVCHGTYCIVAPLHHYTPSYILHVGVVVYKEESLRGAGCAYVCVFVCVRVFGPTEY